MNRIALLFVLVGCAGCGVDVTNPVTKDDPTKQDIYFVTMYAAGLSMDLIENPCTEELVQSAVVYFDSPQLDSVLVRSQQGCKKNGAPPKILQREITIDSIGTVTAENLGLAANVYVHASYRSERALGNLGLLGPYWFKYSVKRRPHQKWRVTDVQPYNPSRD